MFVAGGYAGATIRAIAAEAGVSVPTVELLFATKARLLKAAIDVAIAGDDEAGAGLDRSALVQRHDAGGRPRPAPRPSLAAHRLIHELPNQRGQRVS